MLENTGIYASHAGNGENTKDILMGNTTQKNFYLETMELINDEVKEKQFIKDILYHPMVKEI